MEKTLLSERKLVDAINSALAKSWSHPERPCRVESLKKASRPDRNWEVDTDSTSGPDLLHAEECSTLRKRVLAELASKYDVLWPT